jgi:hypothetical protein
LGNPNQTPPLKVSGAIGPYSNLILTVMKLELIQSVNPVVPSKGTNAGKQMFVINGKHWAKIEPKPQDTHVCLEDVTVDGKDYVNVVGYSQDVRMDLQSKIKIVTSNDAAYATAIAMLLK